MNPKGSVNRANRSVYERAMQMRAQGKICTQIRAATGVARSVLGTWFREQKRKAA